MAPVEQILVLSFSKRYEFEITSARDTSSANIYCTCKATQSTARAIIVEIHMHMPLENEHPTQNHQRYPKDDSVRLGCTSSKSPTNGDDQNTISDSDCQRGDPSGEKSITSAGAATAGKILEQLQELQAAHLKYVDADRQRLQARLNETDEHRRKIVVDMQRLEDQIKELLAESSTEIE